MSAADKLVVLRELVQAHSQPHELVQAHSQPHPGTLQREPIYYFQGIAPSALQHHALTDPPSVDDALLEEMHVEGLIDIDYHGSSWSLVPTPGGRELIEGQERVQAGAAADVAPLVSAVARQAEASNKFGWPAVRPVLEALRAYWEQAGFSQHGIQLPPLIEAVPDDQAALFAATIRALVAEEYLLATYGLGAVVTNDLGESLQLPAEVALTGRAHAVLDGWPGAGPDELVENLLAVLVKQAAEEPDPARKRRLESFAETIREIGVTTVGDLLSRVLTGGL